MLCTHNVEHKNTPSLNILTQTHSKNKGKPKTILAKWVNGRFYNHLFVKFLYLQVLCYTVNLKFQLITKDYPSLEYPEKLFPLFPSHHLVQPSKTSLIWEILATSSRWRVTKCAMFAIFLSPPFIFPSSNIWWKPVWKRGQENMMVFRPLWCCEYEILWRWRDKGHPPFPSPASIYVINLSLMYKLRSVAYQ